MADSFDPNANNQVRALAVQADGKILAGGIFTNIGGQPRNFIARLDATTGAADLFDSNANNHVRAIAVQADGKILAAGLFTNIGGQPRNRITRLNATTGLADSFDPNADLDVNSIAVQADGKILAGGKFTTIGGQSRSLFARLSNDTAASQNLAVTQTTITWTRGGSSPQFTRVTFESSTDNVSYTALGNGTAAGSNWILTGLNLSTGQNFFIRARGYYRSGDDNGIGEHRGIRAECVYPRQLPVPTRSSPESCMAARPSISICRFPGARASNAGVAERTMITRSIFSFANPSLSRSAPVVTGGTGKRQQPQIDADRITTSST